MFKMPSSFYSGLAVTMGLLAGARAKAPEISTRGGGDVTVSIGAGNSFSIECPVLASNELIGCSGAEVEVRNNACRARQAPCEGPGVEVNPLTGICQPKADAVGDLREELMRLLREQKDQIEDDIIGKLEDQKGEIDEKYQSKGAAKSATEELEAVVEGAENCRSKGLVFNSDDSLCVFPECAAEVGAGSVAYNDTVDGMMFCTADGEWVLLAEATIIPADTSAHVATFSNEGHPGGGDYNTRQWLVKTDPGLSHWLDEGTFGACSAFDGSGDAPPSDAQIEECKSAAWNTARSDTLRAVERRGATIGIRQWTLDKEYTMKELMNLPDDTDVFVSTTLIKDPRTDEMAMATTSDISFLKIKNNRNNDGCMIQTMATHGECAGGVGCILDGEDNRDRHGNHYCVSDIASNANGAWSYSDPRTTFEQHQVWLYMV